MFETVLVANRGEIACRVIRTLRALDVRSVAIYTDADAGAKHLGLADRAVRVESYLDVAGVLAAAAKTGAQAIHPGYGFLSENVDFARACAAASVVFIGPGVDAIEAMADKIRAKEHVVARGVPVIPGAGTSAMTDAALIDAASDVGFPLLIKPSAGGGGKGMTVVRDPADLPDALVASRRVALKAFGDDTLLLEKLVATPRHIEVQVLADAHGTTVHLGERECSLQRRNQKVIEEAPSPLLDEITRAAIGEAACEVARSVSYVGAGTVEFLVSDASPGEFFFMEMNTRLQVEHPVTELVTGIDLVAWQLRIAAGEPLDFAQDDVVLTGHAVEARLYAEDPAAGFLPSTGEVLTLREATADGVRVDSSLVDGLVVASAYDPMLAKIIAWGADRDQALTRLEHALEDTVVLGVRTNLAFLLALVRDNDVRAGRLDTGLIERLSVDYPAPDATAQAAAALIEHASAWQPGTPWAQPSGFRLGHPRAARYHVGAPVDVLGSPEASVVTIAGIEHDASWNGSTLLFDGEVFRFDWVRTGSETWLARAGQTHVIRRGRDRERRSHAEGAASPEVRSPMPGTVVAVPTATATVVVAGQPLVTIEAMKMEHTMLASVAGVVTITVSPGDQVRIDQVVARIEPHEGAAS